MEDRKLKLSISEVGNTAKLIHFFKKLSASSKRLVCFPSDMKKDIWLELELRFDQPRPTPIEKSECERET